MDYHRIYSMLIKAARIDQTDVYKETHHIVPRCMGGTDAADNLIRLTARQHFVAHWLLFKIHRTTKLANAWYSMCRVGRGQDARRVNSRNFEYAKRARAALLSESMRGERNPFFGKRHPDDVLERIRQSNIGRTASSETRAKMSAARQGIKKSEDHKKKIGRKQLLPLRNVNTGESIRVPREQAKELDTQIWVNHYTYKLMHATEVRCPFCGKSAKDSSAFRQWHFRNCKYKSEQI